MKYTKVIEILTQLIQSGGWSDEEQEALSEACDIVQTHKENMTGHEQATDEDAATEAAGNTTSQLTKCIHCDAWINPALGADSPAEHSGHEGTETDPRTPGDFDNVCDDCNYGKGLRGGPAAGK